MELGAATAVAIGARAIRARGPATASRRASRGSPGCASRFLTLLLGATAFVYLRGELDALPVSLRIVFVTIARGVRARGGLRGRAPRAAGASARSRRRRSSLDQLTWTAIVYVTGRRDERRDVVLRAHLPRRRDPRRPARRAPRRGARASASTALLCAAFALRLGHAAARPGRRRATSSSPAQLVYPLLSTRSASTSSRCSRATSPSACASPAARSQAANAARRRGRAARRARPHRRRARARDPQPARVDLRARSRCSASRRRSPTRTGTSATSSSARRRA